MRQIVLMLAVAITALAQDQVVTIEAVPKPIEPPAYTTPNGPKIMGQSSALTPDFAPDLIGKTVGPVDPNRYYIIHTATPDRTKAAFQTESWNTYQQSLQSPTFLQRASDPWTDWFKEKRIFGSADAALVYLYWIRS